jgi:sigma-B regulation protein RsbQ
MELERRNNVKVSGKGPATLIFSHGFGCDQSMWRYLAPGFEDRFRVVLYDLVGAGGSDLAAYSASRYDSLDGYADDLAHVIEQFAVGPVIIVGHSVSAMIGALADRQSPGRIAGHVMISIRTTMSVGSPSKMSIRFWTLWTATTWVGPAPWRRRSWGLRGSPRWVSS